MKKKTFNQLAFLRRVSVPYELTHENGFVTSQIYALASRTSSLSHDALSDGMDSLVSLANPS